MKWSEKAWNRIEPIYKQTLQSPFIQELMNGTLAREKFIYYIQQDVYYLVDYGKVLSGIASRLEEADHAASFLHFSGSCQEVERAMHGTFLQGVKREEWPEMSPTCLLYTSFLLRQLANAPIEVMVAAVLPCFWIYKEVGDYILLHQTTANNPYQEWIDTYGGEVFTESVRRAIEITDLLADGATEKQQAAMMNAFVTCSKLEHLFWDGAYRLEKWSI